jgi:ornithine decarboxylase
MLRYHVTLNVVQIHRNFPSAKTVLRILPPVCECVYAVGNKYGASYENVGALIESAKQLQLNITGVSFHVGSGCKDVAVYAQAIRLSRRVFDDLMRAGFIPTLLDIGGGLPGKDHVTPKFEDAASLINMALDECFPTEMGVTIIAEPGSFLVAKAVKIAASVICRKTPQELVVNYQRRRHPDTEQSNVPHFGYFINDGTYGSFQATLVGGQVWPHALSERCDGQQLLASAVFGPTLDGLDCVSQHCELPELDIGDWVYFDDVGDYSLTLATSFNGMPKPLPHYVIDRNDVSAVNNGHAEAEVQ